uniref:Uncharacterized protein n=1 Tax=Cryptomonas curvata TaxID=233186 RepID=A0A7S0QMV8_9CRYP|mmetsp:Transcript_37368/g.78254  ORF Transcript_37368/g.78254 Transcript_37368/m.78254 type:complete len:271 (+) Transcript_37368:29-841(+)
MFSCIRPGMSLTDVPVDVFAKHMAPQLALDDMYRLAHTCRDMRLIAKPSIEMVEQKDMDMMKLLHEASSHVGANIGLPIQFDRVKVQGKPPLTFDGTVQLPGGRETKYSEISIYDGYFTIDGGLVWRFPGHEDAMQVKFIFMLPRQEPVLGGRGFYRMKSKESIAEFIFGQMAGACRNSLTHEDDGVSFRQVMTEWYQSELYWEEERDNYWDQMDDDDDWGDESIINQGSVDDDEGGNKDEVIVVDDIEMGQRDDCIILGDDDCMIVEVA